MRTSLATLFVIAAGLLVLTSGQAVAAAKQSSAKTVTIAMHDAGCHWFSVGGKFVKTLAAKGPVTLANYDEAAIKVTGSSGIKLDPVGKKITLQRGIYKITMVGQAPDDNTLKLTVT